LHLGTGSLLLLGYLHYHLLLLHHLLLLEKGLLLQRVLEEGDHPGLLLLSSSLANLCSLLVPLREQRLQLPLYDA